MAAFNKFNSFVEALAEKAHNLGADDLRIALTNTAPAASDTQYLPGSAHPVPAAANGYPAGGVAPVISSSSQSGGVYKLVLADGVFTATAGGIGPFRYAILYNNTAAGDELIGWWDYGTSITLLDGETLTVDFDPGTGVLTIT